MKIIKPSENFSTEGEDKGKTSNFLVLTLIYCLGFIAPLWLPFLAAKFCNLLSLIFGFNRELFEGIVYTSTIVSCLIGMVTVASGLSFNKILSVLGVMLYLAVSFVIVFFVGWSVLLTAGIGR